MRPIFLYFFPMYFVHSLERQCRARFVMRKTISIFIMIQFSDDFVLHFINKKFFTATFSSITDAIFMGKKIKPFGRWSWIWWNNRWKVYSIKKERTKKNWNFKWISLIYFTQFSLQLFNSWMNFKKICFFLASLF